MIPPGEDGMEAWSDRKLVRHHRRQWKQATHPFETGFGRDGGARRPFRRRRRLICASSFSPSPLRRVWRVNGQPIRSSGNRAFDDSVLAALESAIDDHATVPAPPRDAVGEYVECRIEFTEGDPRRCWVQP
jgi:hypothetical protein